MTTKKYIESTVEQLHAAVEGARLAAAREYAQQVHGHVLEAVRELDDGDAVNVIRDFATARGISTEGLDRFVAGDGEIIVARDQKPFALDEYDECLQAACSSAGGEWRDDTPIRGCKARAGISTAERLATFAAYHINSQECLWRTTGGLLGRLWDKIF